MLDRFNDAGIHGLGEDPLDLPAQAEKYKDLGRERASEILKRQFPDKKSEIAKLSKESCIQTVCLHVKPRRVQHSWDHEF